MGVSGWMLARNSRRIVWKPEPGYPHQVPPGVDHWVRVDGLEPLVESPHFGCDGFDRSHVDAVSRCSGGHGWAKRLIGSKIE